jgi:hypothetical protein
MADMAGVPQLFKFLAEAIAVFIALLLMAFLVSRQFHDKRLRKRIILGAITLYLLAFAGYFMLISAL